MIALHLRQRQGSKCRVCTPVCMQHLLLLLLRRRLVVVVVVVTSTAAHCRVAVQVCHMQIVCVAVVWDCKGEGCLGAWVGLRGGGVGCVCDIGRGGLLEAVVVHLLQATPTHTDGCCWLTDGGCLVAFLVGRSVQLTHPSFSACACLLLFQGRWIYPPRLPVTSSRSSSQPRQPPHLHPQVASWADRAPHRHTWCMSDLGLQLPTQPRPTSSPGKLRIPPRRGAQPAASTRTTSNRLPQP